jgi:small subunit ribosomal protein S8
MSLTTTDPIADMLTRIRNAILVRKSEVVLPHSRAKESIARLLEKSSMIDSVNVVDGNVGKSLQLTLNGPSTNARITEIKRISRPGRRHYSNATTIPIVKRGRGIIIISTSRGIMTGEEARLQNIGGELICEVY